MDEVDFTMLAATSVFGDLSSKCPPAEACRDAFERTAKATIKMANTTGGFGQIASRKKKNTKGSGAGYTGSREAAANRPKHAHRMSADPGATRPPLTQRNSYSSSQQQSAQGTPAQTGGYQMAMPNSTTQADQDAYAMLRTMTNTALSTGSGSDIGNMPDGSPIDPSLLPSPGPVQSPGSGASLTPQSTSQYPQTTPGSNFNTMMQSPSSNFTPGAINYADLQGMDFLQGLQDSSDPNYTNNDVQMDMGFGLGWESMHHDFSEGQQVDLFDGFFFGGQQGGAGAPP